MTKRDKARARIQRRLHRQAVAALANGRNPFVAPLLVKSKQERQVKPPKTPQPIKVTPSKRVLREGRREGWRRADGSVNYYAYIESKAWKKRRKAFLDAVGRACDICGSTEKIQVHHRTYVNLGCERDADLQPLCQGCHENQHEGFVDGVADPMTREFLSLNL
jgi:5-methylcytosine-specific restriction endonuclease McrA